jgi:hypothetical protein
MREQDRNLLIECPELSPLILGADGMPTREGMCFPNPAGETGMVISVSELWSVEDAAENPNFGAKRDTMRVVAIH